MQGKETSAFLHQPAVLHILLIPSLSLHLLLLLIILLLLLIILILFSSSSPFLHYTLPFPPPSGSLESLQPLPLRLQGPVGQALECLHTGLISSSPRFQNKYRFKIIHRLQDIDRFHSYQKTLMFRLSNKLSYIGKIRNILQKSLIH